MKLLCRASWTPVQREKHKPQRQCNPTHCGRGPRSRRSPWGRNDHRGPPCRSGHHRTRHADRSGRSGRGAGRYSSSRRCVLRARGSRETACGRQRWRRPSLGSLAGPARNANTHTSCFRGCAVLRGLCSCLLGGTLQPACQPAQVLTAPAVLWVASLSMSHLSSAEQCCCQGQDGQHHHSLAPHCTMAPVIHAHRSAGGWLRHAMRSINVRWLVDAVSCFIMTAAHTCQLLLSVTAQNHPAVAIFRTSVNLQCR